MKTGIYAIVNVKTGRHYVGQSVCLDVRFNKHIGDLNRRSHKNPHLQSSWIYHGPEAFVFIVLETVERDVHKLRHAEQFWMDQCSIRRIAMYNVSASAVSRLGVPHSEETKRKVSLAKKRNPLTVEDLARLAKARKGSRKSEAWKKLMITRRRGMFPKGAEPWNKDRGGYKFSDEARKRMSEAKKKIFAAMTFDERKQFAQRTKA